MIFIIVTMIATQEVLPQRHPPRRRDEESRNSLRLFAALRDAFLAATLLLTISQVARTQTIYTVVLGNQDYVVGSSTLRSGLFVSYNSAKTWKHVGPENLKAYSMDAVDSSNGRILYIAAGNGVHRSTDYGKSWKIVTDWRMTEVMDVKVDQNNPNYVYAATAFGFWRSTDGGNTWENPEGRLKERYCYRFIRSFADPHLLIATDRGFYLSSDSGSSLTPAIADSDCRGLWVIDSNQILTACGDRTEVREMPHLLSTLPLDPEWNSLIGKLPTIRAIVTPETAPSKRDIHIATYDIALNGLNEAYLATEKKGREVTWWEDGSQLSWYPDRDTLYPYALHALLYIPVRKGDEKKPVLDSRILIGTFGNGLYWRERQKWEPAGLPGSQVWRIFKKEYDVPEEVGHEH